MGYSNTIFLSRYHNYLETELLIFIESRRRLWATFQRLIQKLINSRRIAYKKGAVYECINGVAYEEMHLFLVYNKMKLFKKN